MSTHKYIDRLCAAATALCLLLAFVFMNGESLGLQPTSSAMGYETRLFDTERVHTIDIVMDDWDGFIETCENEEYTPCAVVIDGEAYKNTGIRAKGNTSLSMVSAMDSDRYSFKLEFDHYETGKTYYGLDKLSLNNIIQDATYMKDYLTYRMMGAFGVDAPLCSYVHITVNGEDWGLYLAVEGVEDAFLQRNYGNDFGELYKPDSTGFGGGRGNGRDFSMGGFLDSEGEEQGQFPGAPPEGFDPSSPFENGAVPSLPDRQGIENGPGGEHGHSGSPGGGFGGGPGGGMGSDDVKLRYIDDDPDSYSNIFQNAKTDITETDQARLIAALKNLSEGEDLENTLDVDEVIRYFVVHNFVCNGDSYTGSMVHNYYLYEEDGQLSMIPWDYNLAYGTFQGGSATSMVNAPIDTPVSGGDSRPMVDWIFGSPAYTALYHQYFQEFLEAVDIAGLIDGAAELIAPYVEKDPTAFYTYEEFQAGMETLRTFCYLRAESISGQLDGTIPSTEEGQAADSSALLDASSITLSTMGTMNHGGGPGGGRGNQGGLQMPEWHSEGLPVSPSPAQEGPETPSREKAPISSAQPPEQGTETDTGAQTVEVLQQSPPNRPEGPGSLEKSGFSQENNGGLPILPDEISGKVSESSLILTAASLVILLAGLVTALLYQRRKQ